MEKRDRSVLPRLVRSLAEVAAVNELIKSPFDEKFYGQYGGNDFSLVLLNEAQYRLIVNSGYYCQPDQPYPVGDPIRVRDQ
jgi:hypothetical protein